MGGGGLGSVQINSPLEFVLHHIYDVSININKIYWVFSQEIHLKKKLLVKENIDLMLDY